MSQAKRVLIRAAPFYAQTAATAATLPLCTRACIETVNEGPSDALAALAVACEDARQRRRAAVREDTKPRPQQGGARISEASLHEMGDSACRYYFRMTADDLIQLAGALELPEKTVTRSGYAFSAVEGLGLTLARFRSSGDEFDLTALFGRGQSAISEIVNHVVLDVVDTWQHLLDFDHNHLLSPANLEHYASCIHAAGAPLHTVIGFLDCTLRRIARPYEHQQSAYSGYKKYHALKYQAVITPNGLFAHLYGPCPGPRNDNKLVEWSRLVEKLRMHAVRPGASADARPAERYLQVYGDPAYGRSAHILSGWEDDSLPERRDFNYRMSVCRMSVEHGFALVVKKWPFLNAWWKQRLFQCPVGAYYIFGVLMTNALCCLYPNQISQKYDCPPPTLSEYFHH